MKNKFYFIFTLFFFFSSYSFYAQEIKIFKVKDFDLKGNVESCNVLAKYGKEEYNFNASGFLTKSVTRYSDTDYDVSYYKYSSNFLIEKRVENFRDKEFDEKTSMAYLYKVDSTKNLKIIEQIVSYNKELIDLYEYHFDAENKLVKILRSNHEGNDETIVVHSTVKDGVKTSYSTNGTMTKELEVIFEKVNDSATEKVVTTKSFLNKLPHQAVTERFNKKGKLLSSKTYELHPILEELRENEVVTYGFDELGVLTRAETKRGKSIDIKNYIYQFDPQGNWVKEIISPDNTYTTRKIKYYPTKEMLEENFD